MVVTSEALDGSARLYLIGGSFHSVKWVIKSLLKSCRVIKLQSVVEFSLYVSWKFVTTVSQGVCVSATMGSRPSGHCRTGHGGTLLVV